MDNTLLAGMSGLADGILKGLEIRDRRKSSTMENDYLDKANTPGSSESNAIKSQHTLLHSAVKSSGVLNDPEAQKALDNWKAQIDDPNISGWALDRTDSNAITKSVTSLLEAKEKANSSQTLLRLRETGPSVDAKIDRLHNANLGTLDKDQTLTKLYQTADNLNNAKINFVNGGATPQEFNELQQAVRSNLGIKGVSGITERSDTYLKSLGITKDTIEQFLSGDLKSVQESDPAMANQVMMLVDLEIKNKKVQIGKHVDKVASGHKSFYSRHPELAADFQDKIQQAKDRISSPEGDSSSQMVTVTNGKETLQIPKEDLPSALKDGYRQQ